MASTSSILLSRFAENPSQSAFFRLKRLLNVVGCATITRLTLTQIGRCCVWGIGSITYSSHIFEMFDDTNMRSGLYPFFHISLLNDCVLWLLKSPITIWGMLPLPSGGSRNCSAGGLYTECTTTQTNYRRKTLEHYNNRNLPDSNNHITPSTTLVSVIGQLLSQKSTMS